MNSSQFENKQLKYLASLLYCSTSDILYLCKNIKSYYSKRIELKSNKVTGKVKTYLDGTPKQRIIRPSYRKLKEVQRSIKLNILSVIPLPPNIYGGVKKKSNISNAAHHKGNKYILTTDLQEFFPSVSYKDIFNLFLKLGYSNHIAHWLTKLTSIEFELPQGTRTSTHIANLVFLDIDNKLIKLCQANKIKYTRYVDDLTFSSQQDFAKLIPSILSIILENKFKISWRKTKYKGEQNITGVDVFPNYIDAPREIKDRLQKDGNGKIIPDSLSLYVDNIRKHNPKALTKVRQRTAGSFASAGGDE